MARSVGSEIRAVLLAIRFGILAFMAENQIKGSGSLSELLEALTDAQLDEQIAYFEELKGTDGSEFGHWKAGTMLSRALEIRHDRLQCRSSDLA
jgi:hypothetical protein